MWFRLYGGFEKFSKIVTGVPGFCETTAAGREGGSGRTGFNSRAAVILDVRKLDQIVRVPGVEAGPLGGGASIGTGILLAFKPLWPAGR